MAAGISIGPDCSWLTRRWTFEQLLADVSARYPEQREACEAFAQLSIIGFLDFDVYGPQRGAQLARMIYTTAKEIVAGRFKSSVEPEFSLLFEDSLLHLIGLFEEDGRYTAGPSEFDQQSE